MTAAEIHKKYEKYVQLLEANKNLILTGAPGTGKTFMAKEIAWCLIDNMLIKHRYLSSYFEGIYYNSKKISDVVNNRTMMVQFHPSYDYSDFVEGLRPISNKEGQLGFERTDGVFKGFCKNSCRETVMLRKKTGAISKDAENKKRLHSWRINDSYLDPIYVAGIDDLYRNCYEAIINEVENGTREWIWYQKEYNIPEFVMKHLQSFTVETYDSDGYYIIDKEINYTDDAYFSCKLFCQFFTTVDNVCEGVCPSEEAIKKEFVSLCENVADNPITYHGLNISSPIILENVASFYYALFYWILFYIRKNYERAYLPAIFIIDEINRGEISKIFGELFFSIDPGYRGKKGKVQTQYQNMIEDNDVFKDGFYVPENVYIIGTMNDIDRSVEDMDFAMQRRFAKVEVTAKESYLKMIAESDDFNADEKEEIKKRMFALNDAILEPELGLGEAYQIGAAYFRKMLNYKEFGMEKAFSMLWDYHLKGLLSEYLRGNHNSKAQLEALKDAYDKKVTKHEESNQDNG